MNIHQMHLRQAAKLSLKAGPLQPTGYYFDKKNNIIIEKTACLVIILRNHNYLKNK
jgi:hypothetical protein